MAYRSLTNQTLHYFSRPHHGVPRNPIECTSAWRGDELRRQGCPEENLDAAQVNEIEKAMACAEATGKPTESLTKQDFPLPSLKTDISRWRKELQQGRGFMVVRGVPVDRWSLSQAEQFFWCFGLHLGIPGAQNPAGHLLGHVRDEVDPTPGRAYRTNANINFHCDAADVVGLLCLKKAKTGGHSRVVSSVSVYNELLKTRPDLVDRLFEPFELDTHGEGDISHFPIEPCRHFRGELRTFYHTDYFRSVVANANLARLSAETNEVLTQYDLIANSPEFYLDMEFEPGDIQLVNNHYLLHARTGYEDHKNPADRRHLLRLWLSLPGSGGFAERFARLRSRLSLTHRLLRIKLNS